ncbi:MAG: hypothetical protein D6751_09185, partial [Deltaproteobacteria bacterium]
TFLTLTLLAGCGGGGGGGGEETADPGYTGVRTQAVIDDSNAQQLALDAYSGYTTAEPIVAPLSIDSSPNRQFAPLARVLYKSLPAFDFAPTPAPLAVYDEPGICGGTATVNYNEGTTTVSGSIVYNNYCDSGIVLNGTITFAGSYDPQTDDVSLTLDTSGLSDGASYVSGSISLQFNINDSFAPISLSMDLILTDALAHTYWVKDYSLVITPGSTFDTVNFSGTFYDYDAGYVVVTTTNPLQVNNFTGIMESGTLHFQGAQGTYADLTATGGGDYTLVVSTGSKYAGTF